MNVEKISKFTAELLLKYYDNNIQLFLDACADDVLWIGPAENQVIRTSRALKSAFAAEHNNLHFAVHDLKAVPLTTGSPHVCEVVLFFIVDTIWPDESVSRVKQRIHFTWVEKMARQKSASAIFPMPSPMMNGIISTLFTMMKIIQNFLWQENAALTGSESKPSTAPSYTWTARKFCTSKPLGTTPLSIQQNKNMSPPKV